MCCDPFCACVIVNWGVMEVGQVNPAQHGQDINVTKDVIFCKKKVPLYKNEATISKIWAPPSCAGGVICSPDLLSKDLY